MGWSSHFARRPAARDVGYAAVVLLGALLIVLTSQNQPYNQNEAKQFEPYDDPDLGVAVTGTRQPPLDPFLGVLVQRVLGNGHWEQRLVPVVAGVGCLLLMVLLLRGLGTGWAGVGALAFMATAPVFLRYSAYTRPYAVPMFLMLLCALAGSRWLDTGRRRWLVLAVGTAFALPLARVPEPTVFLAAAALVLTVAGLGRRLPRDRAWWLAGGLLAGLTTIGAYSALSLARETEQTSADTALLDLDPGRALGRLPAGARELRDYVLPLYAEWFPWWPLLLLVVVAALALRESRACLLSTWFWLPLVLAPLVFLAAYHSVMAYPLDIRHYRVRFAYFWIPPLTLAVATVLLAVGEVTARIGGARRWLVAALAAAVVVAQLPMTWRVLTENDAADLAIAGEMIQEHVPDGALVVYDAAAPPSRWRQPFFGRDRFLGGAERLVTADRIARARLRVADDAPTYLMLLDSECASTVVCDGPDADFDGEVPGYEQVARGDRFTLYAPEGERRGAAGTVRALLALVEAFGQEWSVTDAAGAARLLRTLGRRDEAAELLTRACDSQPPEQREACLTEIADLGLAELRAPG